MRALLVTGRHPSRRSIMMRFSEVSKIYLRQLFHLSKELDPTYIPLNFCTYVEGKNVLYKSVKTNKFLAPPFGSFFLEFPANIFK